ncbi:M48 family metalloprotease [Brachybacterium subflavum]|uniref:M48 family metalloprotease n=1 Tax=Brachybacterium subflavum TaxID=2585206 RepID=UPI0012662905|nr:M48 family metalloprotease [Brachybacterium subflavum]
MSYLRALPALLMLILYPVLVIALVVIVVALLVLTIVELRSVLAHELGHYAAGCCALGSFLLHAQRALVAIGRNSSGPWGLLFRGYARLYVWAAQLSSREMERAADGFSLRLAGSDARTC